jgi:hypothetical protein
MLLSYRLERKEVSRALTQSFTQYVIAQGPRQGSLRFARSDKTSGF